MRPDAPCHRQIRIAALASLVALIVSALGIGRGPATAGPEPGNSKRDPERLVQSESLPLLDASSGFEETGEPIAHQESTAKQAARAALSSEQVCGILPIAANEYWLGTYGHCPYDNCGEPYSFVRDPGQPPPFQSTDGGVTWQRNYCANPYSDNTCQGPYGGYSENYGRAFALLGADAKPNYGSIDPRSGVILDSRYDALVDGGQWQRLLGDNQWAHNVAPMPDGQGGAAMDEVIRAGGYSRVPLPRAIHEPPPDYLQGWGYCWDVPEGPDTCFNYPEMGRSIPYDVLQLLSGARATYLAQVMYDDGNYVDGRYAPGQRIAILVYNGVTGDQWGAGGGGGKSDAAVIVGYFRAVIVGYGTDMNHPCNCAPFDGECFEGCLGGGGNPNTVYGLAETPLVIDPTPLLPPDSPPFVPHSPVPTDTASSVPLTQTLSWQGGARDEACDPVSYTLAFGPLDPPPAVATGLITPSYDPGGLLTATTYYWVVTATDGLHTTTGPRWRFTTIPGPYAIYLPATCKPNCEMGP